MRLGRRRHPTRPSPTGETAALRAARAHGIHLDQPQRRAAAILETTAESVYLWGPVGRGKSWLMDSYQASRPADEVLRVHFHEFFRDLHLALRRHRHDLTAALDEILTGVRMVCFDEFHVHDPADGVFLARLLPALLARRIRLIVTSNYPPRSLMPNPLFHDGFLPTIELIERSLTVVAVDGPVDYRTITAHGSGFAADGPGFSADGSGFAAGWWVSPGTTEQRRRRGLPDAVDTARAGAAFHTLSPAGHPLRVRRASDDHLWIDFRDLCEDTTAPADYLALARSFDTWVIDGIGDLRDAGREPAQRFANVVDVLYDHDICATFIASTSLDQLAAGAGAGAGVGASAGAKAESEAGAKAGASAPLDLDRVLSRLGQLRQEPLASVGEPIR